MTSGSPNTPSRSSLSWNAWPTATPNSRSAAMASGPAPASAAPMCSGRSTVYAAVNHYGTALPDGVARPAVEVVEYAFNDHEGGQAHQEARQLAWLAER